MSWERGAPSTIVIKNYNYSLVWQSLVKYCYNYCFVIAMISYQSQVISDIQHCYKVVTGVMSAPCVCQHCLLVYYQLREIIMTRLNARLWPKWCCTQLRTRVKTVKIVSHNTYRNTSSLPCCGNWLHCWPNSRPHPPPTQSKKPRVDTISQAPAVAELGMMHHNTVFSN